MNTFFTHTHKGCAVVVVAAFFAGTLVGVALLNSAKNASLANSKKSLSGFESQEWRTGATGIVVSVSDTSLTISPRNGDQQTFAIDGKTKVVKTKLNQELKRFDPVQEEVTINDITVGTEVGINLISNFKGTPRVEQIYLFPAIQ